MARRWRNASPQPIGDPQIDRLECYCTTATCGAGVLDAGATLTARDQPAQLRRIVVERSGGSEAGWGINFAHQGGTIFASWFTYDLTGKAWWLVMSANQTGPNSYSGTLFRQPVQRSMRCRSRRSEAPAAQPAPRSAPAP
jgi:hypothetical protein